MKKKDLKVLKKVFSVALTVAASLFALGILFIVSFYFWDKHAFYRNYHQAVVRCGKQPYVILSSVGDGAVTSYDIFPTDHSYRYHLIQLSSVYAYACSPQQAKDHIKAGYSGVPEGDLNIHVWPEPPTD